MYIFPNFILIKWKISMSKHQAGNTNLIVSIQNNFFTKMFSLTFQVHDTMFQDTITTYVDKRNPVPILFCSNFILYFPYILPNITCKNLYILKYVWLFLRKYQINPNKMYKYLNTNVCYIIAKRKNVKELIRLQLLYFHDKTTH